MTKILFKHDDEGMRQAIGRALGTWGYLSLEAANVHCLYEQAISENPSIILLDLMIPVTDTLAALKLLSACQNRAIPVIILSNSDDPQHELLCRQEGAFDYIGRGWTLQNLRNSIQIALTKRSSSEST